MASDSVYREALADFRRCMQERGYAVDSPAAAKQSLQAAADAPSPSLELLRQHELALANADAACDARVSLDARARAARRRATDAIGRTDANGAAWAEELASALQRARHFIAAAPEAMAPRNVAPRARSTRPTTLPTGAPGDSNLIDGDASRVAIINQHGEAAP